MAIDAFGAIAGQQGINPEHVLARTGEDGIAVREPLNPPGAWTKFKAALSNVPLLGKLGSLQQARAEVESYPVRLQQYQASNRQILAGFLADIRETYGEHIADMTARDMNMVDGAPLTARTVSTVLHNIDRTQQQYRSLNNQSVTRFLESALAGGARIPGETDMHGIWLDRGMPLDGRASWQDAVGPGAARFITQQVMKRCEQLPAHSQGRLDNAQIAEAARQTLDLYQELLGAPGMTPEALDGILARVAASRQRDGAAAGAASAREFVIVAHMEKLLDRNDPASMLRQASAEIAGEMGVDEVPPAVLKCIARNMIEDLSYRTERMAEEFGCANDVREIIRELGPRLQAHVREAISQHLQAYAEIDRSALSEAGKAMLREIAAERRIDPVQLSQYVAMSGAMDEALQALAVGIEQGTPSQGLELLSQALTAIEDGLEAMKQHGNDLWESSSLSGGEFTMQLLRQVMDMVSRGLSADQAGELVDVLTGAGGRQLLRGMTLAADLRMAGQLPMMYATLIESVAMRAGRTPEQALQLARVTGDGDPPPLHSLPPDLIRAVLTSDPGAIDHRGVVSGSRNGSRIARDFDPGRVLAENRDAILEHMGASEQSQQPGICRTMSVDIGRATFVMDGVLIGDVRTDRQHTEQSFLSHFSNDGPGRAMALAVSRCMNQNGINAFVEANNAQAFPGQFVSLADGKTVHEAWEEDDGSWTVRSTHTNRPNAFAPHDGNGGVTSLDTSGASVYTVTYRIQPPGQPGGDPHISIVDTQVAFGI